MPLVAHSSLPTFAQLRDQGHEILTLDHAVHQDIRELHIGFLNMMPDSALQATERQFIRLVGASNPIAQFFVHPFSLAELGRGPTAKSYIDRYYSQFDTLAKSGLDALIVTGANVANPDLRAEKFWDPLMAVVDWAQHNVASILCSCLATHALLKHFHGIDRRPLPAKRWGVYSHRLQDKEHPLLHQVNTRFDAPHSRYNDISADQLQRCGLRVRASSEEGGVHLAVSPDGFRVVYFQGHPEYDHNSLWKEFKREVWRHCRGEIDTAPPYPEHYFDADTVAMAKDYLSLAGRYGKDHPDLAALEARIQARLDNTWGDTAKAIINNWLGAVYRVTNLDRGRQYMPNVDPSDPLGLTT